MAWILCASSLVLGGCDDDDGDTDAAVEVDAGARDGGAPGEDAGPFVCANPAWESGGTPPGTPAPRVTELAVDRTVDGAASVAFDAAAVSLDEARFDLGVQAGAMTADAALLWTHVSDPGPVTVRVWRASETAGEVSLAVEQIADSMDGGYVHAQVSGLAPATRYGYAFFTGGAPDFTGRSAIGSFVTAPPAGEQATVRFAATSCTNQSTRPFEALSAMAGEDPDLFVHVGDILYNDGVTPTRAAYRANWAAQLDDPGFRDLLSATGAYFTWDDHEVTDSAEYFEVPQSRRDIAYDTYFETLATPSVTRDGRRDLWTSYTWGDAVEIIVLDSRAERDEASREGPDARYISAEQMAFVQERLLNSTATFRVLLNSVPITGLPIPPWAFEFDRWQGYAAQREELLSFIVDNEIENVWFLTGDFHLGFVSRVEIDGGARDIWEVAVGPGGSSSNPLPLLVENGITEEQDAFPCEMFAYWSSASNVSTLLDFDGGTGAVRVQFTDVETGESLFDETLWNE